MNKKTVYTIANAHLDTIWSWDFETTVSKYIYNTLNENFKRFEKHPEYKFNFEGAYRYELMKEYYPEMWQQMKSYVADGRWNVCGSAFENGDVNVPSPEALFRNILIGNEYFHKNFGKRSCDIFLPDCFGFGYALPSIMHHANLKGFTTQKLTWGSAYGVPFDIGKWYGVDGNYVYANINPGSYVKVLTSVRDNSFVTKKMKENEAYSLDMTAIFHGVGDRGGAPKELSVETVCKEIRQNSENDTEVLSASADKIFHDIEKLPENVKEKLPVWNNELVMTNHAVGGYTSRAIGKRWNRRNEEIADMAERACVAANTVNGYEYPQKALTTAWKRVIAHQFHDDLPGTSVQRAYRRSWNDYAMSLNQFTNEYEGAVRSIASRIDTSFVKGVPVIVNNPMEYERTGFVTVKISANFCGKNVTVYDADGKEYPAQITDVQNGIATVIMSVTVPPMGYKAFDLRAKKCSVKSKLSASIDTLENEKYTVKFNGNGDICSIFDKELKREIVKNPIVTGIFDYNGSKSWPAWELNFEELNREPQNIAKIKTIKVVENGPCRVALRIEKTFKDSTFVSIVALSKGGKVVEVYNETEWRAKRHLAKEIFSFTSENAVATYDLGLGAIKRGNMNDKLFEVPAQKWADITDNSKEFGVSVISECKYGWDKFDSNTLRLTLIHTPLKNYRIDSMQSMMDLGLNRYSYGIYSHNGCVGHETQCEARDFIMPMATFITSVHNGDLGSEYSFGSLSGNAIIRAVKKAENSDEIIIRINESEKKEQKGVILSLNCEILSAREIYASEEHISDISLVDGNLVFDLKPYEIKSFALKIKKAERRISRNTIIDIIGNVTAFSSNSRPEGSLPVIGKTIPQEITPERIISNGISFELPKDGKAMLCGGQTLQLPTGTKKAYLLAASLNGDKFVKINDRAYKINDIHEYYAGWDLYDFGEVAFTKEGKLGYEFTHSHTATGDAQCRQLFLWNVEVDVCDDKISLPVNREILILAVTADSNVTECALACEIYDKINGRTFDYKENLKEKITYLNCKNSFLLNDKGGAIRHRNKGRRK